LFQADNDFEVAADQEEDKNIEHMSGEVQGKDEEIATADFDVMIAFWFLIYSDFATVAAFLMAGIWGAGNSIMPLAAGAARGSDFQEAAISVVATETRAKV
jgi:hypothetical protein